MSTPSLRDRTSRAAGPAQTVARKEPAAPVTLAQRVQQLSDSGALAAALPKHVTPDRITRIVLTALRTNPQLAECTENSFLGSVLTSAQLGLEVNTPAAEAYLVPYRHRRGPLAGQTECQLIIGYQGYAKLFWQSNDAKHLDAQVVYERDEFDYAYGLDPYLRHKPAMGDRGDVLCFYAVATLRSGGSAFVVLNPDEVAKLRANDREQSVRDPQQWMSRKTAIRQVLKLMPKSPELAAAVVADETVRTDLGPIEAMATRAPAQIEGEAAPVGVNPQSGELDNGWPTPASIPNGVQIEDPDLYGGDPYA